MNPLIIVSIVYAIGYALSVVFHIYSDRYLCARIPSRYEDELPLVLIFHMVWPFTLPYMVVGFLGALPEARREEFKKARRKSIEAERDRRREMIKTINNDIDRNEPRRRDEILAGTPVIDIRQDGEKKRCYVCNKVRSPYVEDYTPHGGSLINTLSGVPAHEECLMADLKEL